MIPVFFHILLLLGYPILLDGFKPVYDILDVSGVDTNFSVCGSDGDFILDDRH